MIGPAVQHEPIALDADRPQRRVAADRRRRSSPRSPHSSSSASIRVGRVGAPQQLIAIVVDARIGQRDPAMHLAGRRRRRCRRRAACSPTCKLDVEPQVVAALAVQPGFEADLPALQVRRPAQHARSQVARHDFQPDRLPDAGGARIPDRVRLAAASPACRAAWRDRSDRPRRGRRWSADLLRPTSAVMSAWKACSPPCKCDVARRR